MKLQTIVALSLLGGSLFTASAAGKLGQEAAPLQIKEWIKGKPVSLAAAKGKQVVVVEFWATWCGPCRTSIPHLTEMQKKFKDQAIFVGISDETASKVKPFVENLGEKMDYVVAIDDARKTSGDYMGAFGVRGIPHAFIVDKNGKLVWHGHPMDNLETVLAEVIAGKYDLAKAEQRDQGRQKLEEFVELVMNNEDAARQDQLAKEITALETEVGPLNANRKFDPAEIRKLVKFNNALRGYQMVLTTNGPADQLADFEKTLTANSPEGFDLKEFQDNLRQSKLFSDYYRIATGRGDAAKLPGLAKQIGELKVTNPQLLNEWAWTLLTDEDIKERDLPLALRLAKAAVDACDGKEAGILDTYARALFDSGKVADAITHQKKAVALASDAEMRKDLNETLKRYEAKAAAK